MPGEFLAELTCVKNRVEWWVGGGAFEGVGHSFAFHDGPLALHSVCEA